MDRLSDLEKVEKAKGELGLKYKVKNMKDVIMQLSSNLFSFFYLFFLI